MNLNLNPNHRSIKAYYQSLAEYARHRAAHEGATSTAFQSLLQEIARERGWTLIPQQRHRLPNKKTIAPDGTLRDQYELVRGYWEAKDSKDDLAAEIRAKMQAGYPLKNTIFEDTRNAVLFQNGNEAFRADLQQPAHLADLLTLFFNYAEPNIEQFEQAVTEFAERVPDLARVLVERVQVAHRDNRKFQQAFDTFYALCKKSLNPNLSVAAVDEMLVQHLLTVRLITTVFDNPFFLRRNVIAREVETVIDALISKAFDPRQFLAGLDRFYVAIENAGRTITDWSEKQEFLNKIYERFFQGYSVKVADTHGIVYTPQPIVDFMCASVVEVLQKEFGKRLGDPDVVILDPATGTGNFVVNLLQRIPARDVEDTYKHRLFANEVMLMPYYIASLNIEHKYYELTGAYEPFEGICFVDTLDLTERQQLTFDFMSEENTERVARQRAAPITVIIGNPPYNVGQLNENDNNKNRRYDDHEKAVDRRIRETYIKDSDGTLHSKLYDAYVRFFRWATDRLGDRDGIVCFVSNNSFINDNSFDGMRKHLFEGFSRIYVVDLQGNIRKDSMRDGIPLGERNTVFGLAAMVGISITILVRNEAYTQPELHYFTVDFRSTRKEKFEILENAKSIKEILFQNLLPDDKGVWKVPEHSDEYASFIPIGNKAARARLEGAEDTIFDTFSLGVSTNRDKIVYDFHSDTLLSRIDTFIENYNSEVDRYKRLKKSQHADEFVNYGLLKWSRNLKRRLISGQYAEYEPTKVQTSLYRPFTKMNLYFSTIICDELGKFKSISPYTGVEIENRIIIVSDKGYRASHFSTVVTNLIPDLHLCASVDGHQCFPFYVYDEDGTNRRENITDWALDTFRAHYGDPAITKWDIFYYVYALLHHPTYRTRYADNLKRELPRIPMVGKPNAESGNDTETHPLAPSKEGEPGEAPLLGGGEGGGSEVFHMLASSGKTLADLHLNYETVTPYRLEWAETATPLSFRVEKMRLSKDKTALVVNDTLTLHGIPAAVYDYKLGNRSALEWVIDQYRITTDPRSGITSDPNRPDDPRYIVNLVEKIITVSLRTVEVVNQIAEHPFIVADES